MKKLISYITKIYLIAIHSIVFYPSVIALLFFFFALLMLYTEYSPFMMSIKQEISVVLVNGADNARVILNNVIGGIISLTVFSFSMVMLVLSQASTTYSPRVIPGLITRKSHQVVLGFYLGTIIYSFMLVINLNPNADEPEVAGMGILFCMIFGIISLALFVYFIHSISTAIQIDNVMNDIFRDTLTKIKALNNNDSSQQSLDTTDWTSIKNPRSGYFREINDAALCRLLRKSDLMIETQREIGTFMIKGEPFLKINKPVNEEVESDILSEFILDTQEAIGEHYLYGFKQISEVAVKALSPGINDPGTALKGIDLLCILLLEKIAHQPVETFSDRENNLRVICEEITLEMLIQNFVMPIHHYGKEDVQIISKLLNSFRKMLDACSQNQQDLPVVMEYLKSIATYADQTFQVATDRKIIDTVIKDLKFE